MPDGKLPFGWKEYKAYLQEIIKEIDYPGVWDKPEREADLKRMISEAESILGASPETAFTAGNFNLLMSLPHFNDVFEYRTGTSPTTWYNLYAKTMPEAPEEPALTPEEEYEWWRKQREYEWALEARVTPAEEQEVAWQRQQALWGREQAMLPYGGMTAYQQAQIQQDRMREAYRLAALGEEGWIERAYAQQAQQAQFEAQPKPWYMRGGGLAGIAGWEGMSPEERGEWLRRKEYSQAWAPVHPQVKGQVLSGYGWPEAPPGQGISYGAEWPGFSEAPQPEFEESLGFKVDIKPSGEVKIERGTPMAGRAAEVTAPTAPAVSGKYPRAEAVSGKYPRVGAPPSPVGAAPPRRGGGRARPQPRGIPTPAWLPQFAPWLTTGEPISKGWMPTPSGQMWGQISPSTLAGLKGFTKWGGAGRSMEDIYSHMLGMQPEVPRGAGYQRWQPVGQR